MPDTIIPILPQLNLNNFSGEIADILRQEVHRTNRNIGGKSEELSHVLEDAETGRSYLLEYENRLKKTFSDILPDEIILHIDKDKFANFANDSLRALKVTTAGKHVDALLSPVMSASIITYAEDSIKEHFAANEEQLIRVVNTGLSILSIQGVKILEITEAELADEFKQMLNSLSVHPLNGILIKNITGKATDLIKHKPGEIVISTEGHLDTLFSDQFNAVRERADEASKAAFTFLGDSIKTLAENEQEVNEVLENMQKDIVEKSKKIASIEDRIKNMLKSPVPDLQELAQHQIEHAKLVAENLFQNNIINSYLKKGIQFIGSIDSLKDKAEKLFSGESLQNFKNKIEELKKPTFSSIVNFASETINTIDQITGTMEKLGIFKNAAKSVGKFVNYAKVAIGIATALLPPNPIGIIGALGSLGGLFGGGGPSIEEQMFEAMQQGFNQLNQRLDDIEAKIDRLTEVVQTMYKNLMQSMQVISNQLDAIKEKVELSNDMLNFIIYKDYNLVESVILGRNDIVDSSGLKFYQRWYNARQITIVALKELGTLIESPINLRGIIKQDFLIPGLEKRFSQAAEVELAAYNKSLLLFKKIFTNIENDQKSKNLLLVPAQKNLLSTFQKGVNLITDTSVFDFEAVTDNYFNSYFIAKLVDQYITLHPFFILSKNNQFEPFSTFDDFLSEDTQQMIKDKFSPTKSRLYNLLDVVNAGIIQQSVLAGSTMMPFINTILFGNDASNFSAAVAAIEANEILAKNIAVFFIHTKIDSAQFAAFSELYYSVRADPAKMTDLNNLLVYGQGRLEFDFDQRNLANPLLCLYYKIKGTADKIQLPLPDLTVIEEKQMVYSNVLFALLDAKEKIITTLLDIGFFKDLSENQSKIYKEVFFLKDISPL